MGHVKFLSRVHLVMNLFRNLFTWNWFPCYRENSFEDLPSFGQASNLLNTLHVNSWWALQGLSTTSCQIINLHNLFACVFCSATSAKIQNPNCKMWSVALVWSKGIFMITNCFIESPFISQCIVHIDCKWKYTLGIKLNNTFRPTWNRREYNNLKILSASKGRYYIW